MNKQANRRAFIVCMIICFIYASVIFKLPERFKFTRVADGNGTTQTGMSITTSNMKQEPATEKISAKTAPVTPNAVPEKKQKITPQAKSNGGDSIEPSYFIAIPIICSAIKVRLIEKEGLISASGNGYNNISWKKPLDILKDKDEEGLKNISKTIGKKHLTDFLKREGIVQDEKLSHEDIILGKGYRIEKKKLLAIYESTVPEDFNVLFPYTAGGVTILKRNNVFEFVAMKDEKRKEQAKNEPEWLMPNLVNLPIKTALETLSAHTSNIRVKGSGVVAEQYPKAFERSRGEAECVLYGRTGRQ